VAATNDMRGKRVLITGAARGIGAEAAIKLAGLGARVAIVGLEPERMDGVVERCGSECFAIEADVSDRDAIERAVNEAAERLGGLDVVVANAGIAGAGTIRSMDPDAFDRTIEVNLMGVWRTIRAALPHIIASKGYVLTIASVAALLHGPMMSAYCASKAGAEAFSNCLRVEVEQYGVNVGVAYFLWIDTDMVRDSDAQPAFAKFRAALKGPAGKTLPVSDAVDAIVGGIQKREYRVYAPGSVSLIQRLRGFGSLFNRDARKAAPEIVRIFEQEVAERGAADASMSERTRNIDPVVHR
jgi:NAD(P)-dependent dehydrogenase (short-subunit alcohol dehydrogenase family)